MRELNNNKRKELDMEHKKTDTFILHITYTRILQVWIYSCVVGAGLLNGAFILKFIYGLLGFFIE